MRSTNLTRVAGWMAVGIGVVHVVVGHLGVWDEWSQALSDGLWNTFTLDDAETVDELQRSEALWTGAASYGFPVLLLGCSILWSLRQGVRTPRWLGWLVVGWGVLLCTAVPASPAWVFLVIGALIVLGDRRRDRDRDRTGAPTAEREGDGGGVAERDNVGVPRQDLPR